MLQINSEQCVGCGACVSACPIGAIHLVDGMATINQTQCRQCEACIAACPWHAISVVLDQKPVAVTRIAEVQDIVPVQAAPITARPTAQTATKVSSWIGAALTFMEREIVPRVAASLLAAWDHHPGEPTPMKIKSQNAQESLDTRGYPHKGRHYRHRRHGR